MLLGWRNTHNHRLFAFWVTVDVKRYSCIWSDTESDDECRKGEAAQPPVRSPPPVCTAIDAERWRRADNNNMSACHLSCRSWHGRLGPWNNLIKYTRTLIFKQLTFKTRCHKWRFYLFTYETHHPRLRIRTKLFFLLRKALQRFACSNQQVEMRDCSL